MPEQDERDGRANFAREELLTRDVTFGPPDLPSDIPKIYPWTSRTCLGQLLYGSHYGLEVVPVMLGRVGTPLVLREYCTRLLVAWLRCYGSEPTPSQLP
jgi:hypothetical protein